MYQKVILKPASCKQSKHTDMHGVNESQRGERVLKKKEKKRDVPAKKKKKNEKKRKKRCGGGEVGKKKKSICFKLCISLVLVLFLAFVSSYAFP